MIAATPTPPYYAVIFTSIRNGEETDYDAMAEEMNRLAIEQRLPRHRKRAQ